MILNNYYKRYVVKSTTKLYKIVLKYLWFCDSMKTVEMTKTKTKNKRRNYEKKEKETIEFSGRKGYF